MSKQSPLKIFYAAGPGDIIGTYRYWKRTEDDPTLLGYTDSGQFYDLVKELGAEGLAISSHKVRESLTDAPFTILHIPKEQAKGWKYHWVYLTYGLKIVIHALLYRPKIAFIEEGTSYWFIWNLLHWAGIAVVPALKCTLWPRKTKSKKQRIFNFLDRGLFQKRALAILSMSSVTTDQVKELTRHHHSPIIPFLPLYKRDIFADIHPPDHRKRPFRVLFIGRIEYYKGVFDILQIAERFKKSGFDDIHFDFCGTGSASEELQRKIQGLGLSETCHYHGYCRRHQLKAKLAESHTVIAPTRISFIEGFCMVVAEGVLAGRPVITSPVCPALYAVGPAAVEAVPDDPASYADAILHLYKDPAFYREKQSACREVSEQFFDPDKSWKAAMKAAIELL